MSRSYLILSLAVTLVSCSPLHHVPVPEFYGNGEGQKPWAGPPAPLNPDGTVAFTPEFHEVASLHHKIHAEEYKRLQETAEYANAHPDLTSLPGNSDSYDDGSYRHQSDESQYHQGSRYKRSLHGYGHGQFKHVIPSPLNHDGTVAYTKEFAATAAHLQATHHSNNAHQLAIIAKQDALASAAGPDIEESHDDDYTPAHYNHFEDSHGYSGHTESYGKYHGPPAPLNHDGTVAHTAEYKAIAASHASAHHGRSRRSAYHGESLYQGPHAPLNHDGTAAETPEVAHLSAEHHAAHAHQLALLAKQEAKALAAGLNKEHHADEEYLTSLSGKSNSYDDGSYRHQSDESQYHLGRRYKRSLHGYGHGQFKHVIPSPLNHDGTVAYTKEFAATAAHLQATHHSNNAHQLAIIAKQDALASAAGPDTEESHDDDYTPAHYNHFEDSHGYSGHTESYGKYHGPPAPLNHDGTVAHTAEYKAIAASHASAHHGRSRRSPYHGESFYQGPHAPLNHDGTAAETPEVAHLSAEHHAAHAHQLALLAKQEAKALAAGLNKEHHADEEYLTSLSGKSNSYDAGSYRHQSDESQYHLGRRYKRSLHGYGHGQFKHVIPSPLNHDGTVAYTKEFAATAAHLQATHHSNNAHQLAIIAKQDALASAAGPDTEESHDDDYTPAHYNHFEDSHGYSGHTESYGKYHGPPAPLNHDGTVAHTAEYKAIAASHASAHHGRSRRSPYHGESFYQGPHAPLNHDGTAAETPEVAHLSAEHHAAHAHQLALLAKQEAKAFIAEPDKDHHDDEEYEHGSMSYHSYSKPSEGYHHEEPSHYSSPNYDGWDHSTSQHGIASWHGPPAPLNHDGTVAQTPEYLAIAAKHAAAPHHHF